MRLPRDLSGSDLAHSLRKLGYSVTRQTGSHLRLTTYEHGEHHLTIPLHSPLRIGTLAASLADVRMHFKLTREQLLDKLFA
jgi:predicted RNA binding protein YcfA (HicA-like mRNA interferase family)